MDLGKIKDFIEDYSDHYVHFKDVNNPTLFEMCTFLMFIKDHDDKSALAKGMIDALAKQYFTIKKRCKVEDQTYLSSHWEKVDSNTIRYWMNSGVIPYSSL